MSYRVKCVNWHADKHHLSKLREQVFVFEWHLPREAEFDEFDHEAHHVLICDAQDIPVATGRLTQEGEVGRIAVRRKHRSLPVYRMLFESLVDIAKKHHIHKLHVRCDLSSVDYHRKLGFTPHGPAFMEAGIPRQRMACKIQNFTLPDVTQMH